LFSCLKTHSSNWAQVAGFKTKSLKELLEESIKVKSVEIISETVEHVGITGFRSSTQSFERILDVRRTTSSLFVGDITFYDDTTETLIGTLPPGVTGFRRPFYDFAADSAGGSVRVAKEKGFVSNLNEVNALFVATVSL